MDNQELIQIIFNGREARNIEYKSSVSWRTQPIRMKLIKSILGMSNIQDGGFIVIGVNQNGENFEPVGMSDDDFESFKQDDVSSLVNEYADPFVELTVSKIENENRKFVVLQVEEFMELPTICKRDGNPILRRGAIYTRSRRRIETSEIQSQIEMRETVDIAVEKGIKYFQQRIASSGIDVKNVEEADSKLFDEELGDL